VAISLSSGGIFFRRNNCFEPKVAKDHGVLFVLVKFHGLQF
jgi:hypothetical protein